jgi:hypothetical protein
MVWEGREAGMGRPEVQILLQGSNKLLVFYALVHCAYNDHACFLFHFDNVYHAWKKGMVAEMFCLVSLPI